MPVLTAAYFVLALVPGYWALVMRQVVFLIPLTVAAVSVAAIVCIAPRSAELRGWSLLGMCVALLWFSEFYFSAYQVYVSPAGPSAPSLYDALNLAAALFVLAALWVAAGVSRLPRATLLVFVADTVSMSAVLFATMYMFWMRVMGTPRVLTSTGIAWAGYSSLGVAILLGVGWLSRGTGLSGHRSVARPLVGALAIFATGAAVWPLWQQGTVGIGPNLVDALDGTVVFIGYSLMMVAALARLEMPREDWLITMGRSIDTTQLRQSSAVSALVLAASAVMGFWAYRLPAGNGERGVLVVAASVAIMGLVARTGFATHETGALRDMSVIDPVTGALNHRAFQDECDERILAGRRQGVPFVLVALDLDGFSRVNGLLGHAEGDDALREVVAALKSAGGRPARVFRLTGDEFAVIGVGVSAASAHTLRRGTARCGCCGRTESGHATVGVGRLRVLRFVPRVEGGVAATGCFRSDLGEVPR